MTTGGELIEAASNHSTEFKPITEANPGRQEVNVKGGDPVCARQVYSGAKQTYSCGAKRAIVLVVPSVV